MAFKDQVKQVREDLHLSQENLAHELGVSFATVNRWENAKKEPSQLARKVFYDFCASKGITFEDKEGE